MHITDADRDAANRLRIELANISGFWHAPGDDGPLCAALARHRIEAEARVAAGNRPLVVAAHAVSDFDPAIAPWERRSRPDRPCFRSLPVVEEQRLKPM